MRAVERTIQILELLAEPGWGKRLVDICRVSGLDGSTALRYLSALTELGYVVADMGDGSRYRLGPGVARLGGSPELLILQRIARPYMEALRNACGEDVNLGTMDAGSALCLETQKSSHILGANFASGLRVPAHASAQGKAILAFLPPQRQAEVLASIEFERFTPTSITTLEALHLELTEVQRRGYSVDREEFTTGVICVGAPVHNSRGDVVGALSITAPTQRMSLRELEANYTRALLDTCYLISKAFGFKTAPGRRPGF
jgi:DNA-binding IclR family transcriptional regulator